MNEQCRGFDLLRVLIYVYLCVSEVGGGADPGCWSESVAQQIGRRLAACVIQGGLARDWVSGYACGNGAARQDAPPHGACSLRGRSKRRKRPTTRRRTRADAQRPRTCRGGGGPVRVQHALPEKRAGTVGLWIT
eukprot:scaffold2004_cov420-Prasinococcus_capsulatus_cf.AAC.22